MDEQRLVGCFASPEALDSLRAPEGTTVCRVAPDELMLIGGVVSVAASSLPLEDDAGAVVLDVTDGWSVHELIGEAARAVFSRLSALHLPREGFVQGEVARVPARVIAGPSSVRILVPAMYGSYLSERIEEAL
ncbi:MAG: hypothetical protein WD276_09025 [Actinomycetota bacterium]